MMTKEVWKLVLTMATWNVRTMLKTVYRTRERKTSFEMDG